MISQRRSRKRCYSYLYPTRAKKVKSRPMTTYSKRSCTNPKTMSHPTALVASKNVDWPRSSILLSHWRLPSCRGTPRTCRLSSSIRRGSPAELQATTKWQWSGSENFRSRRRQCQMGCSSYGSKKNTWVRLWSTLRRKTSNTSRTCATSCSTRTYSKVSATCPELL